MPLIADLEDTIDCSGLSLRPTMADLVEEREWLEMLLALYFDARRLRGDELTTFDMLALLSESRHRLVAAIGGAA
jgi:hypothetical protein